MQIQRTFFNRSNYRNCIVTIMIKSPIIKVRSLRYSFTEGGAKKAVLQGIDMDIFPGEIVIIMGPSGSGKTTLLKLLGSLRKLQEGEIIIENLSLGAASNREMVSLRRRVGFIFQAHHLLAALSVLQNVQMPLAFNPKESKQSAEIKAWSFLKEVGLEAHAHKKPSLLSGGQKQRVAIARALIHQPPIVLADEPTASLDRKTGREVVNLIQKLSRQSGSTIVLVTHDNRILDIADRIVNMEDGRILSDQPPG